ncbi:MAG: anti-sigma factor family protein [Pseudomonadota bacterium]
MTDPSAIVCTQLVELVTDYLEGALPPERRRAFDEHLERCPGCVTYVEHMRQTLRATGSLEPEQLAPEQRRALLDLFGSLRE